VGALRGSPLGAGNSMRAVYSTVGYGVSEERRGNILKGSSMGIENDPSHPIPIKIRVIERIGA